MPSFHNRTKTHSAGVVASTGLLLASQGATAAAAAAFGAADNVAVYWGQNSYNQASGDLAQQSLADYCANTNIDIIPMSFLVQITTGQGGQPVINLANAGNNCTLFPDSALLDCPQIGEDIKTCQDTYNKTILMSIGGATYTEGGFASEDKAVEAANLVWETFGPANSSASSDVPTNATTGSGTASMGMATGTGSMSMTGQNRTAPAAAPSPTLDYDPQDPLWAVSLLAKLTETTDAASTGFKTRTSNGASSKVERTTANPTASPDHKDHSKTQKTAASKNQKHQKKETIYETHTDYATNNRVETIVDATGTRFIPPGKATTTSDSTPSSTHSAHAEKTTPKIRMVNYDGTSVSRRQSSSVLRPFHDAAVDGFDLDIEAPGQNFPAFANRLRALMDAEKKTQKTDKNYYLTVAPQCPYPDLNNDAMLNGGVSFDAVFVQFYNNYCGVQSFTPNTTTQNNFNFETWHNWATKNSTNPDVKIFVGVPAGASAAGSGYEPVMDLAPVIAYSKTFSSFGGIMAWDASQAYANGGFLKGVKENLKAPAAKVMKTPKSPKATPKQTREGGKSRAVRRGTRQPWWA